jgi:[ribosomal protein S18]-alanine N-acetyltransferase
VEASELSIQFIFLEVRADNQAAISLYDSRHFNRISERLKYYPDGETAIIMRRDSKQIGAQVQR